jgi:hypothetical protein
MGAGEETVSVAVGILAVPPMPKLIEIDGVTVVV